MQPIFDQILVQNSSTLNIKIELQIMLNTLDRAVNQLSGENFW